MGIGYDHIESERERERGEDKFTGSGLVDDVTIVIICG